VPGLEWNESVSSALSRSCLPMKMLLSGRSYSLLAQTSRGIFEIKEGLETITLGSGDPCTRDLERHDE
jgi:hypothetical protein